MVEFLRRLACELAVEKSMLRREHGGEEFPVVAKPLRQHGGKRQSSVRRFGDA